MLTGRHQLRTGCNEKRAFTWAVQKGLLHLGGDNQISELRKQNSSTCGDGTDTQHFLGKPVYFTKVYAA